VTATRLPPEAIALVKHFEGCRLDAYTDPAGVRTIGYGHTEKVRRRASITPKQADEFLRHDLNAAQAEVLRRVKVRLNENENAALVSLAFNIGGPAFARSTCVKLLNRGNRKGAADEMKRFVKAHVKGRLVTLKGLELRRKAESDLFLCEPGEESNGGYLFLANQTIPLGAQPPPQAPVRKIEVARAQPKANAARQIALAAGLGGGVGVVPALDQVADAWKNAGGADLRPAVHNGMEAFNHWLMRLPYAEEVRRLAENAIHYLQTHQLTAIALTVLAIYLLRRAIVRLRSA
jgi:lysozyme